MPSPVSPGDWAAMILAMMSDASSAVAVGPWRRGAEADGGDAGRTSVTHEVVPSHLPAVSHRGAVPSVLPVRLPVCCLGRKRKLRQTLLLGKAAATRIGALGGKGGHEGRA